ncbi:unnamed protein product [Phytophthora lilii]|uniref:Unnamed protein product n=1 Tax=Phytophthora lilii TaxID=2077276 RepID=A0A9W6TEE2_9STRA|nr:unnamed protein product [Phytophthora lilii]
MPDRPCTFDPGNDPLRPISLRPQGLSRVTKVWRQLQGNPVGRSESSDLGFASWERGHWIPIGAIEHWLDDFAQEVGEDSAEFQAILAAWIEFDRARNLRADRYRQQVPHRYWDWAIRPSSDPAHIPPELMLEPTILTFSFEVILWIPKTADWVSEVSVVDDRQPWRNCWIDVPRQHPHHHLCTLQSSGASLRPTWIYPAASPRRHYAEPAVIGARYYFTLGSGAIEPPDTARHSSSCFSGCSC